MRLTRKTIALVGLVACLLVPVAGMSETLYSRAEMTGSVGSVFPESGLIVINDERYLVANDVQVIKRSGEVFEAGIAAIKSGTAVEFGLDRDASKPTISVIILMDQR